MREHLFAGAISTCTKYTRSNSYSKIVIFYCFTLQFCASIFVSIENMLKLKKIFYFFVRGALLPDREHLWTFKHAEIFLKSPNFTQTHMRGKSSPYTNP